MIDRTAEAFWRAEIAKEIKDLIDISPEVNAYGVYLFVKNGMVYDV